MHSFVTKAHKDKRRHQNATVDVYDCSLKVPHIAVGHLSGLGYHVWSCDLVSQIDASLSEDQSV